MKNKIYNYFIELKKEHFFYHRKGVILLVLLILFATERIISLTLRNATINYHYIGGNIIHKVLAIKPVFNHGIGFSILSHLPGVTIFLEILFTLVMIFILITTSSKYLALGIGLMWIGSFSNLIEHIFFFHDGAYDFIEFIPAGIIFNIADMYIFFGFFIAVYAFVFTDSKILHKVFSKKKKSKATQTEIKNE